MSGIPESGWSCATSTGEVEDIDALPKIRLTLAADIQRNDKERLAVALRRAMHAASRAIAEVETMATIDVHTEHERLKKEVCRISTS